MLKNASELHLKTYSNCLSRQR